MICRRLRLGPNTLGSPLLSILTALILLLLLAATTALGQGGRDGEPVLSPEQEERAETIFDELISPCCWTTTVAQHGSGAAPRIQAEVRRMLAAGETHQEILDHYVEEYGERILAKPKKKGFNLAAYWVPYLGLLFGGVAIFLSVRRGMRRARRPASMTADSAAQIKETKSRTGPRPVPGSDDDYRRRIEEELRHSS